MSLAELSYLLGAPPKWVLNAMTSLGLRKGYSIDLAGRLAVTRAIQSTGISLRRSFQAAGRALREPRTPGRPVTVVGGDGAVELRVDVERVLSALNVRLSALRSRYSPMQRGRPPLRKVDPLAAAAEWGTDIGLLKDNLSKSVEQRIRQLDSMAAFARSVTRASASPPRD